MTTITVYRISTPVAVIDIDEKTIFTQKLMAEHKISASFVAQSVLNVTVGDYITIGSQNFYINQSPGVKKLNNISYEYKIEFESVLYDLEKKVFLWPVSNGLGEFSYNGMASDFVTLIVNNMNATFSGWTSGTVDSTTYRTLTFSNESCRDALNKVAQAFSLEYSLSGKAISMKANVGSNTGYVFHYGKNQGLYSIAREQVSDQNIITKVFGFGSTNNIPSTYRSRAKRLVFDDTGNRYLTKNTGIYGTIEGIYTDETIYPRLLGTPGTLTGASIVWDGSNLFDAKNSYVADSNITGWNPQDNIISGSTPKIVFTSGACSGIEFEIWKWDNTNKRFYFNAYGDTDGYTTPFYNGGSPVKPQVGDTYVLTGITMPQSYIDTAEAALKAATQAYLDKMSQPQVIYSIEFDPRYIRSNSVAIGVGDRVTIIDTELGVNTMIRISSLSYPLTDPNKIKVLISDFVPYTFQERSVQAIITNSNSLVISTVNSMELTRKTSFRLNQLKDLMFDPDGYFDPVNIKPLSINTIYLSVGTSSTDFRLLGVTIKPNYLNDRNRLVVSAGTLAHNVFNNSGNYVWTISGGYDSGAGGLTDGTAYYLYAKCSTSAQTGTWQVTTAQRPVNYEAGYNWFWVGILYAANGSPRDYDFVTGMTYINGSVITTGKIQSADTLNYLDLANNTFRIGGANNSMSWDGSTLTIQGALTVSGTTTFPVMVYRGSYGSGTTYYKGDIVSYSSSNWIYVNDTPGSGHTPADDAYWDPYGGGGGIGYPGAGIALSTGSAWSSSITNNSGNWNTAYGWGNHASAGYAPLANPTFIGIATVPQIQIRTTTATDGSVRIVAGDSSHSGYIGIYKTGTDSRLGYLGYDNTNMVLTIEQGMFTISGSDLDLGTTARTIWNNTTGIFALKTNADAGQILLSTGTTANYITKINLAGRNTGTGIQFFTRSNEILRVFDTGEFGSPSFSSGFAGSGWQINGATLTVDNLVVRNVMSVYQSEVQKISAVSGGLIVSPANGICISVADQGGGIYRLYFDEDGTNKQITFSQYDIVRMRRWDGRSVVSYIGEVDSVSHNATYGQAYIQCTNLVNTPNSGDIVQIGNTTTAARQNFIYITSADSNNPYMDILSGVSSTDWTGKTRVRLGNLTGISDSAFGGSLSGYGLYAQNVYLKGKIQITEGSGTNILDPSGWVLGSTGVQTTTWTWNLCGSSGQNDIIETNAPDGGIGKVWRCTSNGGANADGGFDTSDLPVNSTKQYRFTVFVQVVNNPGTGSVYFGCGANTVRNIADNSLNGNPYFCELGRSAFTAGDWYLIVGYVYPYNSSNTTSKGGIYHVKTGNKITSFSNNYEFRWAGSGTNVSNVRALQYYTTGAGNLQYFYNPRVEICDGQEPTVDSLLKKTVFQKASDVGVAGLYLNSDYVGYYNGSVWTSYFDNSGNAKFSNVVELGTHAVSTPGFGTYNFALKGGELWENSVNGTSALLINWNGYVQGTTQYRNTIIGDGKNNQMLLSDGANNLVQVGFGASHIVDLKVSGLIESFDGTTSPASQSTAINQNHIYHSLGMDGQTTYINYVGNGGGTSYYRNTVIGNGRGGALFTANGSGGLSYANGYFGIDVSPSYRFHVNGGHSSAQILLHSDGNSTPTTMADLFLWASEPSVTWTNVGIANNRGNSGTGFPRINTSRGGSYIRLGQDAIYMSNMDASGNEHYCFDLSGYTLTLYGNVYASNFILSSDERKKRFISPLYIRDLEIPYKEFELYAEPGIRRYGVIAQEIRPKYPELVREDKDGVLSVAYIDLMIREIAYLKDELKKLKDGNRPG